jgi:hypothetical protein
VSAVVDKQQEQFSTTEPVSHMAPTGGRRLRTAVSWPTAALVGLTAIGATFLYWLVHVAFIDDAYITLTYARTLAEHGEWGMLPGHEANSATSPLNVLLMGGLTAIFNDPVVALGVLYVLTCVVLALGLRGLGETLGLGHRVAVIGTPLFVASPLLASTIGLETMLVVTALTYLTWACARGDAMMAGITLGVLLWLRLDTVVIAGILVLATPALWRRLIQIVALAAAVVGPWLVFSWIAFDSAIPDTLVIKQGGAWGDFLTALTTRYYHKNSWAAIIVLVIGALGLLAALTWPAWRRRGVAAGSSVVPGLVVAGAAYFVLIWELDVPPFFWYYAPTLTALTLTAVIGLATLSGPDYRVYVRAAAAAASVVLIVMTLVPWWPRISTAVPMREMPIHANWARPYEYAEIGRELGNIVGDTPVHGPGEVGTLAYFCECTIVDRFTDRAVLADKIRQGRHDSLFYRLNYHGLNLSTLHPIKPGYWLVWRHGPDTSGLGWDTTGLAGARAHGHFVLLDHPPTKRKRGQDGAQGQISDPRAPASDPQQQLLRPGEER